MQSFFFVDLCCRSANPCASALDTTPRSAALRKSPLQLYVNVPSLRLLFVHLLSLRQIQLLLTRCKRLEKTRHLIGRHILHACQAIYLDPCVRSEQALSHAVVHSKDILDLGLLRLLQLLEDNLEAVWMRKMDGMGSVTYRISWKQDTRKKGLKLTSKTTCHPSSASTPAPRPSCLSAGPPPPPPPTRP